eukprot:5686487-Prymnesium_polylepis.1
MAAVLPWTFWASWLGGKEAEAARDRGQSSSSDAWTNARETAPKRTEAYPVQHCEEASRPAEEVTCEPASENDDVATGGNDDYRLPEALVPAEQLPPAEGARRTSCESSASARAPSVCTPEQSEARREPAISGAGGREAVERPWWSQASDDDAMHEGVPLSCAHCEAQLDGPVYCYEDQMYCCQRHRIAGYVQGEGHGRRRDETRLSNTGLRAQFRTWLE